MKPKKTFKPQNLRTVLSLVLAVSIIGGAGLFYLGYQTVKSYAVEVNHSIRDAEASGQQVSQLQTLRGQLAESENLVTKANQLFATPESYQSQVLTDIRTYASASGVRVAGTDFGDPGANAAYEVTLRLESPVSYTALIGFLDRIESNVPKLQITSLKLSHDTNGDADSVTVDSIKIEVVTK